MKTKLRQELLAKRLELDEPYRNRASIIIAQKCIAYIGKVNSLALYHPVNAEVNALLLTDYSQQHGIALSLPTVGNNSFAKWSPGDALELINNTPQPVVRVIARPEAIIVPLIGFDRHCNRLGYGGGFYDKALANLPQALKIGVAYATQECEAIPVEEHDIQLDMIITEDGLYENNR